MHFPRSFGGYKVASSVRKIGGCLHVPQVQERARKRGFHMLCCAARACARTRMWARALDPTHPVHVDAGGVSGSVGPGMPCDTLLAVLLLDCTPSRWRPDYVGCFRVDQSKRHGAYPSAITTAACIQCCFTMSRLRVGCTVPAMCCVLCSQRAEYNMDNPSHTLTPSRAC